MDTRPSFADFGLPTPLVNELARQGFTEPFPIQLVTIADALAGRDILGRCRTGFGKTLAFALPLLARLLESGKQRERNAPRAVVLVPTRELANQVCAVIAPLAATLNMRTAVVYGGVGYNKQIEQMRNGVDVVVACPGRFIDLMESGHIDLDAVEITVLDEADHMAELGFLEHVTQILSRTPKEGQRMLFSATLDRAIDKIVRKFLNNPITHEVESTEEDDATMTHYFFEVTQNDRFEVISDLCSAPGRALVFTRTKHGARKLTEALVKAGVPSVELHGDLSQNVRARNLAAYSSGKADTLVATDIAARGIHVDDIALVIHADPPEEHKAFLHRSGRTARAGAEGTVITIVTESMRRHVKRLARDAGIDPITKRVAVGDELLNEIAPGERVFREMPNLEERRARNGGPGSRSSGRDRGRGSGGGGGFRDRDSRGRSPGGDGGFRNRDDRRGTEQTDDDARGDRAPGDAGAGERTFRSDRGADFRSPRGPDYRGRGPGGGGGFRGDRDSRGPRSSDDRPRGPRPDGERTFGGPRSGGGARPGGPRGDSRGRSGPRSR